MPCASPPPPPAPPCPPSALAGLHRDLPVCLRIPVLLALAHPLVARVAPHTLLAPVQQRVRRHHVRRVRRRRLQAVRQPRCRVHTDMRLHPKVPLIALRLAHLRVPLASARRRRGDDARVHDRSSTACPSEAKCALIASTRLAQGRASPAVAEVQDRRRVQRSQEPQPDKPPHRLHLVKQVGGRSGCRTTARSARAASPKAGTAGDRDRPSDRTAQCAPPAGPMGSARPSSRGIPRAASAASSRRVPTPKSSPVPSHARHVVTNYVDHDRIDLFRPSLERFRLRRKRSDSLSLTAAGRRALARACRRDGHPPPRGRRIRGGPRLRPVARPCMSDARYRPNLDGPHGGGSA